MTMHSFRARQKDTRFLFIIAGFQNQKKMSSNWASVVAVAIPCPSLAISVRDRVRYNY
jgi:hypothetical protein